MSITHLDRLKVDLSWSVSDIGFAANVFQCLVSQGTPHSVSDQVCITDMATWMEAILEPLEPHVVVSVDVVEATVYKWVTDQWNLINQVVVAFTPGSIDDPLPSGVAALVSAYTDTSKVMGKKYFPGLAEAGQTAGVWVAGVLTALAAAGLAWVTSFASDGDGDTFYNPGVYSTKALSFKFFTPAAYVRDIPAYQRRRKAGVGS